MSTRGGTLDGSEDVKVEWKSKKVEQGKEGQSGDRAE